MASRQGMIGTTIALGIAFTLGAPLTASAQAAAEQASRPCTRQGGGAAPAGAQGGGGGGRGGGAPPYTPAAGARDLRSVLFNWGWHLGMLRSDQERDIDRIARVSGEGHHASGWAALQR